MAQSAANQEPQKEDAKVSLEEMLASLEEIVDQLNDSGCSLEQSFALYKEGMELLQSSQRAIDQVEKQMLEISKEGEVHEFFTGTPETV